MFNISDRKKDDYSLPIKILSKGNTEEKFINFDYKRVGYVNWFYKDIDLMYYYTSTKIYKLIEFDIFKNKKGIYAINMCLIRDKESLNITSHPAHLYDDPKELIDRILSFAYECGDYSIVQRDDKLLTRIIIQYSDSTLPKSYYDEINERILFYYNDDYKKWLHVIKTEMILYKVEGIPYGTYTIRELSDMCTDRIYSLEGLYNNICKNKVNS